MPSKKLARQGVTKEKFDRCVQHVKSNSPGANPYAVCNSSLDRSKGKRKK